MSVSAAKLIFGSTRNCFVEITQGLIGTGSKSEESKKFQVFEILSDNCDKAYVSWSGEITKAVTDTDGAVKINGLYADKLGLKDGTQVLLRPMSSQPSCQSVYVEPLTVNDWEILERHASFIESNLLNQVRVIWSGQVLPIWVERSICIFLKIGNVEPKEDFVVLCNETEVIVSPKVRNQSIGQIRPHNVHEPLEKGVANPVGTVRPTVQIPSKSPEKHFPMRKNRSAVSPTKSESRVRNRKRLSENYKIQEEDHSGNWRQLFSMLGLKGLYEPKRLESESSDEEDLADNQTDCTLASGLNIVLRVQAMKYNPNPKDNRRFSLTKPMKPSKFLPWRVPEQSSTIYVDKSDLESQWKCKRMDIPDVFLAKCRPLPSPKKLEQEKLNWSGGKPKPSPRRSKNNVTENGQDSERSIDDPDQPDTVLDKSSPAEQDSSAVVRVVVLDRRRQFCNESYGETVSRLLEEQPFIKGHVIVPDMLRRMLKSDVTSRVWLQTFEAKVKKATAFSLHPLGNLPRNVTGEMIQGAFRVWLECVSDELRPLIVFQGLFIKFPVLRDSYIEAQITFKESSPQNSNESYTVLHPNILNSVSLSLVSGVRVAELTHPSIQPMLAYTSIHSFDPVVPDLTLDRLGGVEDIAEMALSHLEMSLGSRPLHKRTFLATPGLMNGVLLITGPKGSGKSSLAKALLRQVADLPNIAYTSVVDFKPMRGKKVDTIQKHFELMFDEAAWRQPGVILFDDIDHLAGAPSGPESEMSGEALYAARVAEVLKDLLRKDIRNMTRIAVVATALSRSSVHPILVSSRGTHLVQEVFNIAPPDKKRRQEILTTIIKNRPTISQSSLDSIDWNWIFSKTEGFVARDLCNIVNRAVHCHLLERGRFTPVEDEMELTAYDFEVAFDGFTPASIRNVPLHKAGELGWDDIGGLQDVRETLVETLQWPTKYPLLFANCPLRLRSGLLLYGAPGTGKTLLAGVVAKECGLNFISIKGPELLSKYIGASEQAVRDIFYRAQSAKPCILFFDEFDSIAPRRGHDNTGVTDRVVNQLLTQLDGVEGLDGVYVLAATSRPDLIDPALLRPGRLDKCLHCKLPNKVERLCILKALTRKMSLSDDVKLEYFADNCEDYTGADFKALLYNAQLEAIHELTDGDDRAESKSLFGRRTKKSKSEVALGIKKGLSNNHKLTAEAVAVQRSRSWIASKFAYIPSLEEGVREVTTEMEEKFSNQINQIRLRERRSSEHIPGDDQLESPLSMAKLLKVRQSHLMAAYSKMRPSVTGDERMKYKRIYENFVTSRGANFGPGYDEMSMKATLA